MSATVLDKDITLSRYRSGSVRESLALFFPLMLSLFSGSLMSFCDRLFLSHFSLGALESVVAAGYFCTFFQFPLTRIVGMAQVSIGKSFGAGDKSMAGPYAWQMVWLSLFSIVLTFPVGIKLIPFLFKAEAIAEEGSAYFRVMMAGNFLFPLAAAFSSCFIGLGKTRVVAVASFGAQVMNIGLNYLLIFGMFPGLPPLGAKGAALGTVIAQGTLVLALFGIFLREESGFRTREFWIRWPLFKELFFVGLPRAFSRALSMAGWNLSVLLVSGLHGDYLLVLSVGSSIWLVYFPIMQAVEQVISSQVAFYHGKKAFGTIWRSFFSCFWVIFGFFCLFGALLLFFFDPFLSFFIPSDLSSESLHFIKLAMLWLWIFFLFEGVNYVSGGVSRGLGLTWFNLVVGIIISFPVNFFPFYLAFQVWHLDPDKVWMAPWSGMIVGSSFMLIRAYCVIRKLKRDGEKKTLLFA